MASSGTVKAYHPSNGAYWSFEWTAKATSTKGQTKVSYDIYKRGKTTSPTWLATDCDIGSHQRGLKHRIHTPCGGERRQRNWICVTGPSMAFHFAVLTSLPSNQT